MKKFLFSLFFLIVMCGVASADFVYSTTSGGLGLVRVSGSESVDIASAKYSGTNANSLIVSYWENTKTNDEGNSKLIFITSHDDPASNDTAIRFNGASIESSIDDVNNPITLQGTHGTTIAASTYSGGGIYVASGACVRKYSAAKFALEKTFEYPSDDVIPNPEVKGIVLNAARVYILVSRNKEESNDIVYNLDGQITPGVQNTSSWEVAPCTKTMQFINGERLAIGHAAGVDIGTTRVVSTDAPVVSLCSDNGNGFYYAVQSNDVSSVYHYSDTTQTSTALITNINGSNVKVYHTDYDVLVAIIGGEMKFYKMEDDTLFKTYTASDLDGTPYNITQALTSGESGNGSSSGCNLSGAGIILAAALLLGMKKSVRNS